MGGLEGRPADYAKLPKASEVSHGRLLMRFNVFFVPWQRNSFCTLVQTVAYIVMQLNATIDIMMRTLSSIFASDSLSR
jgi:hypothetical protein